jgi:hypothetical protein
MDFQPRDVITPPRVPGIDLIDYLLTHVELAKGPAEAFQWTSAADVIDPAEYYTGSLEAKSDRSVARWLPPEESGLATIIIFSQGAEMAVLIRYSYSGPASRGR